MRLIGERPNSPVNFKISAGLHEFFGWFCVALFEGTTNASTLMVCLGKKKLGSTSPGIFPTFVTHMKHLHTYLAEISSFVFSQLTKILLLIVQN